MIELDAYAKINWDLRILGKRADGYHEIDSVMATVDLADRLTIEDAGALAFSCSEPSIPTDESNLVLKAARALATAAGVQARGRIHLEKKIPAGGGLGGGSSDAAAALRGLNELWKLNWPTERLAIVAAGIGSDVAYFLWGGWRRCRGRGEIVEALPGSESWPPLKLLLLVPPVGVSTPAAYKALGAPLWDGRSGLRGLTGISDSISIQIRRFLEGISQPGWPANDLIAAACAVEPQIGKLQKSLQAACPGWWQMSGSGSVHFVVAPSQKSGGLGGKRIVDAIGLDLKVVEAVTITPRQSP